MRGLRRRSRMRWISLVSGGGLLVLGGCDPNVRDTVLSGVEASSTTLMTSFISAFFESLAEEPEEPATVWVLPDSVFTSTA